MSAFGLVSSIFVMLKLPYLNYSKRLTMQPVLHFSEEPFGQKKPSRTSGLAANWYWLYYDEALGAVYGTF